jgi:peptidoglycan/xylan/chitin deacetylase (PgdA/CDA1 family)
MNKTYFFIVFVLIILINLYVVSRPLFSAPLTKPFTAKAYVLCYHTFLGKPKVFTDFSISEFSSHIQLLRSNGFSFITLKQLKQKQYSGNKNIVLIIDDGNKTAYQAYKIVLKPLGIKPVFAIYPNVISKAKYAMTWGQLKEVVQEGCEIGSHGFYHLYLKSKFYQEDPKGFEKEIVYSKKVLEKELGISVQDFIYPFGVKSPEAVSLLKSTGYAYAYSLKVKPVEMDTEDHFDMPRYMLTRSMATSILQTITKGL